MVAGGSAACITLIISVPDRMRRASLCHAPRAAVGVALEAGEQQHRSITASRAGTISTSG